MPKFVITCSSSPEFKIWVPLGLDFMWPEFWLAADKHYEIYSGLIKTLQQNENGQILMDIARIRLVNSRLLQRVIFDEKNLRILLDLSNSILKEYPIEGHEFHDPKKFPFSIFRLQYIAKTNQRVRDVLQEIANSDPKIEVEEDFTFCEQEKMRGVSLEEFLEPDDVFYIRYCETFNAKLMKDLKSLHSILSTKSVKFPVSLHSFDFNDKLVVQQDSELKKFSLPCDILTLKDNPDVVRQLSELYKSYGDREGLVLKPYASSSGNAVILLDAGIKGDDLQRKCEEAIAMLQHQAQAIHRMYFINYDSIIVQQRLHSLTMISGRHDLHCGDIRFTAINGELVGAVLRFSPSNVEEILSFQIVKSLLPNNLIFNRENIERLIMKSQEEKDFEALAYYKNLADIHFAAMEVTRWCKENQHFHIGFDILLGRNSQGQWRFCLTELNNVWPDCIPETRRINRDCLEEESKIDICRTIVESIMSNRYISRIDPHASISLDRGSSDAIKPLKEPTTASAAKDS